MQKHAMALGYFFLAVFCWFTSFHARVNIELVVLRFAALAAALMGLGFLWSACAGTFRLSKEWLLPMWRLAREPPVRSTPQETVE